MEPATETFNVKHLPDTSFAVEVTLNETVKFTHKESDLLRRKAYFESMIEKGQAGLDRTNELLAHIQNAK